MINTDSGINDIKLEDYGYRPDGDVIPEGARPARVTAVYRERYGFVCSGGTGQAVLKSSVYYNGGEPFPTAGDFTAVEFHPGGESRIVKTLERRSYFSRLDPTPGRGEQAVAANFDYVFILTSPGRDFNPRRLERYLALAWKSGALPAVILTKSDLAEDIGAMRRQAERTAGAAAVFAVSALTGEGLVQLGDYLKPKKTLVFLGSSGVGKSSLVNALAGRDIMETGGIREDDGRGRHTTTARQLIMMPGGYMIIDTPGMREIGMWDVSEGLGEAFEDVKRYFGRCKFRDCSHGGEPGCAVREAIISGELSAQRWESYKSLRQEARFADNKAEALRDKQKRNKQIALYQKQLKKNEKSVPAAEVSFICRSCGYAVAPEGAGSAHRNHCPRCLCSLHLDNEPGDRASLCGGVMEPVGVWVKKNGEWAIIHRCRECGTLCANRIAADDNPALLMSIAVQPLAAPPFPLASLGLM